MLREPWLLREARGSAASSWRGRRRRRPPRRPFHHRIPSTIPPPRPLRHRVPSAPRDSPAPRRGQGPPAGAGAGAGDGSAGKSRVLRLGTFSFSGRGGEIAVFPRKTWKKPKSNKTDEREGEFWQALLADRQRLLLPTGETPTAPAQAPNGPEPPVPRRPAEHAGFVPPASKEQGVGRTTTACRAVGLRLPAPRTAPVPCHQLLRGQGRATESGDHR